MKTLRRIATLIAVPVVIFACSSADGPGDPRHYELDQVGSQLPKGTAGAANGDLDYCTGGLPCAIGEGDCDADAECTIGLLCGYDNGPQFGMGNGWDVCVPPTCRNQVQDAGEAGIDCGGTSQCGNCVTCPLFPNGHLDHCSTQCQCPAKEGDCDSSTECQSGLVCAAGKGTQFGLGNIDVCLAPHCVNGTQDADETGTDCGGVDCGTCSTCLPNGQANTCSPTCKCQSGWGDCDSINECQSGLVCGNKNGAKFGMHPSFDVCVPPHCVNGQQDAAQGETGVDCGGPCGNCDSAPTPATSCQGGDQNLCGPLGSENCCFSPSVAGGTFSRNYDGVLLTDPNNKLATVSKFYLDKFEITVGRFRKFVNAFDAWRGGGNPAAGAGAHPKISGSGWDATWPLAADATTLAAGLKCDPTYQTWTDSAGANEARPINCVTWHELFAFCMWDAGRLPTEAEWNFAASGGNQQRVYPWSNPASSTSISQSNANYQCGGDGCTSGSAELKIAGLLTGGLGRYGQADLGGNVWEWVLDWYTTTLPYPCTNCADVSTTTSPWRVIHSGSWATNSTTNLASGFRERGAVNAGQRFVHVGARCARD